MDTVYKVSSNPHIRSKNTTQKIMLTVAVALLPACCFGVWHFGLHAFLLLLISAATCLLTEILGQKVLKRDATYMDGSALVTGLLLGMNLPPAAPLWLPVIGGIFAILVVKLLFGGLGQNIMNPALAARAFLTISFAKRMTDFSTDVITGATPLARLKAGEAVNTFNMVTGRTGGCIGETSVIAIMVGAMILLMMGVIDLKIPGTYIVSFLLFYVIFSGHGFSPYYLTAQLAGGGLMLGAFFMATDYVTSPITTKGKLIYGVFLGVMTGLFRVFGATAEGVSYSIIIGNLLVPLIDKFTVGLPFGKAGAGKEGGR